MKGRLKTGAYLFVKVLLFVINTLDLKVSLYLIMYTVKGRTCAIVWLPCNAALWSYLFL